MSLLKAEVKYYPYPLPVGLWRQKHFWVDELKMNLLWLVMPEIDDLVKVEWPGNPVSESIDKLLDKKLRSLLSGPPVEFMRDFVALDTGDLAIAEFWPENYQRTMWARAKEANARLVHGLGLNVLKIDFRNGRKFG